MAIRLPDIIKDWAKISGAEVLWADHQFFGHHRCVAHFKGKPLLGFSFHFEVTETKPEEDLKIQELEGLDLFAAIINLLASLFQ